MERLFARQRRDRSQKGIVLFVEGDLCCGPEFHQLLSKGSHPRREGKKGIGKSANPFKNAAVVGYHNKTNPGTFINSTPLTPLL